MAQIITLVVLAAVLVAMVAISRRTKLRRVAADEARRENLSAGSEVMTTSGLYATVVSINDDGTALLSIAPGVEVKWTIAALREVTELPDVYRAPLEAPQRRSDSGDLGPNQP